MYGSLINSLVQDDWTKVPADGGDWIEFKLSKQPFDGRKARSAYEVYDSN